MKIEYNGFIIEPCDVAIGRFDLKKTIIRTKKDKENSEEKGEQYTALQDIAYGIQLDRAYELITTSLTEVKLGEATVSPSEYAEAYRQVKKDFKAFINNSIKF